MIRRSVLSTVERGGEVVGCLRIEEDGQSWCDGCLERLNWFVGVCDLQFCLWGDGEISSWRWS